jgi:hypothetical protein
MGFDGQVRVQGEQVFGGGLDLGPAGVGGGEQHLALQVGQRDGVGVDQAQGPHPGGGQIEGGRRPRPPAPTTRTRAAFSFCWPGPPISRSTRWRA